MQDRRLTITVPVDEYKALTALGRREVRSPEQQASYFVRQALAKVDCRPEPAR